MPKYAHRFEVHERLLTLRDRFETEASKSRDAYQQSNDPHDAGQSVAWDEALRLVRLAVAGKCPCSTCAPTDP